MTGRISGPLIGVLWLASMAWLFHHDVWPAWTAQDLPRVTPSEWAEQGIPPAQLGIFDRDGIRVGTIRTTYDVTARSIRRFDVIDIKTGAEFGFGQIEVDSTFLAEGVLDEFLLKVTDAPVPVEVKGERFMSEFALDVQFGSFRRTLKIPSTQSGMIGDSLRPFGLLPGLRVGQTWRMQVFNPMAAVLGSGRQFTPAVVRVSRKETITTSDGPVECFVVEAPSLTAWVDAAGRVRVQEVEPAFGGRYTIREEPYVPGD